MGQNGDLTEIIIKQIDADRTRPSPIFIGWDLTRLDHGPVRFGPV